MRLVAERARARGRHGPRSCLAWGGETTFGEVQRHRPVQHVLSSDQSGGSRRCPWEARERDSLVIFPRPGERSQRLTVRVAIGTGDQAVLVLSPAFPSDPEMHPGRVQQAPQRASRVPARSSLLVLQHARRVARPPPQDVAAARPPRCLSLSTSLPLPGPRPRQPWARGHPYEPLSVMPTPCLRVCLRSIAQRALRVVTVSWYRSPSVSCHARATNQLDDRGEREDAEQKKRPAAAPWPARKRTALSSFPVGSSLTEASWYVSRTEPVMRRSACHHGLPDRP